jgi:VanZ family protein
MFLKRFIIRRAAPWIWAALIFLAYSIPGKNLDQFDPWNLFQYDKAIHLTLFGVFSFLLCYFFSLKYAGKASFWRNYFPAMLIALCYGSVLEYFQSDWFSGRFTDPGDFIANALGAFVGVPLQIIWERKMRWSE